MNYKQLKEQTFLFFEHPKSLIAKSVQLFIVFLIVSSVGFIIIEHGFPKIFLEYQVYFHYYDLFILVVFTIEYVLRLWSSPKKIKFVFSFYNLIDLIAITPIILHVTDATGVRLIRVLRLFRISRIFKLFKYTKFANTLFGLKDTILEKILPVIVTFAVLKTCIFFLESNGWWLQNYDLNTTFAVVGFALGIILSQKIGVAYSKFILLEDSVTRIHGIMISIKNILKGYYVDQSKYSILHEWVDVFHKILLRKENKNKFYEIDEVLYRRLEPLVKANMGYSDLISLYARLNEEASFLLNRMDALTPKAYDELLHKSTIIYSLLLIVFVPGIAGIISTIISIYVLYGMYQITEDMDNAMAHMEHTLVNADINDLILLKEKLI